MDWVSAVCVRFDADGCVGGGGAVGVLVRVFTVQCVFNSIFRTVLALCRASTFTDASGLTDGPMAC
jgi:hypothetical protein